MYLPSIQADWPEAPPAGLRSALALGALSLDGNQTLVSGQQLRAGAKAADIKPYLIDFYRLHLFPRVDRAWVSD